MTARDHHTIKLNCPCGQYGEADVSDNDGYAFLRSGPERRIKELRGTFIWHDSHFGGEFTCTACGKEV